MKGVKSLIDFYFRSANGRMQELVRTFNHVARTNTPVLIVGEPGTGKELVAQALHQRSLRSEEPFLKIDCQLTAKPLLETQLDGIQLCSFRASSSHGNGAGQADLPQDPGSIYFHEIGDLGLDSQMKVLPFLPNRDMDGTGELLEERQLLPRLIASTSLDLRQEVGRGRFRPDLYFNLAGVMLEIPALRYRKDDLAALAEYLLRRYAREFGRVERPQLTPKALEILCNYDWPGNLPELSSMLKRIVFLGDAEVALEELSQNGVPLKAPTENHAEQQRDKTGLKALAKEAAQRVEREIILQVLRERQWNRKRAAAALDISYKTLLSKIKQLGLTNEA